MPIYRDKTRGCFVFEFDRVVGGRRVRTRKVLPKAWTRAQADAYDRTRSAELYAITQGVSRTERRIEDAVLVYLKERAPQLKTGENVERELELMQWVYQGQPLSALAEVCRRYAAEATRTADDPRPLSAASIRNRIRYLTAACRYGWKHHGMGENDPAARVTIPTVRNERQTYIDRGQMLHLARACTNRAGRCAIRIAFYSGMRLSEILRADPTPAGFRLLDTKNGTPRIVPVHPKAASAARALDRSTPKITIQRAFQRARAAVGMPEVHFHDIRHSAASAMINAGVDLYTVGAVLGHADPRSTKRYAHLATDTLAAAVGRIGAKAAA